MRSVAPVAPKLAKLIPLLSSDKDGEALATVRAIGRTLAAAGLSFHDLAAAITSEPLRVEASEPPPAAPDAELDLETIVTELKSCPKLKAWETTFVHSIASLIRRGATISTRQAETLRGIYTERAA